LASLWRLRFAGDLANADETVVSNHAVNHVSEHSYLLWFDDQLTPHLRPSKPPTAAELRAAKWGIGGLGVGLHDGQLGPANDRKPDARTEVAIEFKRAPFAMFRDTPVDRLARNFLVMSIQPDECIGLQFNAKVPGPAVAISGVNMTFKYQDYFDAAPSSGYETLIYDCMIGDAILFQRADAIEAGWRAVQPFLDAWRNAGPGGLAVYKAGSEGPAEADQLLARDGRRWRPIA